MFGRKKNKKKTDNVLWCVEYTKRLITIITICYFICTAVEIGLIILAIYTTGEFSFLDTFISENSDVFKVIMSATILKFGIENIFKYNDFGGRVPTKEAPEEMIMNEEVLSDDDIFGD